MQVKLQFKIFAVFSMAAVILVLFMILSLRYFFIRHFTEFVNRMDVERLETLRDDLTTAYQADMGWERIRSDPRYWVRMVATALQTRDDDEIPPQQPNTLGTAPQLSSEPRRRHRRMDRDDPPAVKHQPPATHDLRRLVRRVFLLDEAGRLIAGQPAGDEETILQPIVSGGRTVGWLGLRKRRALHAPLEAAFLQRQYALFYVLGGGLLVITAIVSFILSRHLLAPVRRLTAGTQALAARRFDTRIAVQSKDELGQLADDFNTMAATLEHYEKLRRQWISDISHELRTPLAVLRGEIEAMQDGVRPLSLQQMSSLHAEILRIGKIVEDLHELSLAQSGALTFRQESLNPIQILAKVLERYAPRLAQRRIHIQDQLGSERQIALIGDRDRFEQLFSNLLENTLRYTDSPGTLTIWQQQTIGRWSLFIEDSGPGVPQEAVPFLFDRLYRVDQSRSRALGGSGLGLSICKSIVETMGGRIDAQNAPAGGLRIRIEFPQALGNPTLPEI
jgi:two-component system, OmpR family, sensor histidine kinase BaeS